jgi:hypothetical protein
MVAPSRWANVVSVIENGLVKGGALPVPGNRMFPKPVREP